MDDILHRLGRPIRELRIERGFSSQEAFADYVGVHRTFIGHLETGRKDFRLTTLIRVSNALGVTLADLFSGIEGGKPGGRTRKNRAAEREVDRNRILKELAQLERAIGRLKEIASKTK